MGQIKSPYMWIPSIVCTILAIGNGVHYMAQIHENYHRKDAEVVFSRTRYVCAHTIIIMKLPTAFPWEPWLQQFPRIGRNWHCTQSPPSLSPSLKQPPDYPATPHPHPHPPAHNRLADIQRCGRQVDLEMMRRTSSKLKNGE